MKILVIAPHCDDGEIGCGGTIQILLERGHEVHYLALSKPAPAIEEETLTATRILGIPQENIRILNYHRRSMPAERQAILDELIKIKTKEKPDVIFTPARTDTHQDHATVSQESVRAFRDKTILGYEEPWNNPTFPTQYFVPLTQKHIDTKIKALQAYRSQKHRHYLTPQAIKSLAKVRGTQIERDYAEAFEAIKIINLL